MPKQEQVPSYTKEICMMLLKWIGGIAIVLILLFKGWALFYSWLYFGEWNTRSENIAQEVTKSLLQIPYSKSATMHDHIVNSLKKGWHDLEPISYEEWMNMECECPDMDNGLYRLMLQGASENALQILGVKEQKRIACLYPYFFLAKRSKNKVPLHCTNMLNCDSISIEVHDYIFKYPKVLRNIIKIAEKPCFYLRDLPDEKMDLKLYQDLALVRMALHCDKNDRPYIVIYILDKNDIQSSQLIIPRIDTADK